MVCEIIYSFNNRTDLCTISIVGRRRSKRRKWNSWVTWREGKIPAYHLMENTHLMLINFGRREALLTASCYCIFHFEE